MIEQILPDQVASADAFGDSSAGELFAEERASLGTAGAKRSAEFAAVRTCARRAMVGLGVPAAPVVRDRDGAPRWPDGLTGSLTHCRGYRAAALARTADVMAIGIDAEPHEPVADALLPYIANADERAHLQRLSGREPATRWERVLFSAKESIYKAWYPMTQRWLNFADAAVTIDPDRGRFSTELLVAGPNRPGAPPVRLDGRWLVREEFIATAVVVGR